MKLTAKYLMSETNTLSPQDKREFEEIIKNSQIDPKDYASEEDFANAVSAFFHYDLADYEEMELEPELKELAIQYYRENR